MNSTLKELIFNPNAFSSTQVNESIQQDHISEEEQFAVLGQEVTRSLRENRNKVISLPYGNTPDSVHGNYDEEYTQIYVWGSQKAGKTSLIGSLFTVLQKDSRKYRWVSEDPKTKEVRETLVRYFSSTKRNFRCLSGKRISPYEIYNVQCEFSLNEQKKDYSLSFIEVSTDSNENEAVKTLLKSKCSKIHLLCFDCSKSKAEQEKQAARFCQLLKNLSNEGVLDTTVGVYVVVTKTDSMVNIPVAYRAMAAQSLITARHRIFWQAVLDVCNEMSIDDVTPIAYSAGDTILQDLIKPDLSAAHRLLERPILLKAQPHAGQFRRFLWRGNGTETYITTAIVILLMIVIGYVAFQAMTTPPDIKPLVYDFSQDFRRRISTDIINADYDSASIAYESMAQEFRTESSIRTTTGDTLTGVHEKDMEFLANSFAARVEQRYKDLYQYRDWTRKTDEFNKLETSVKSLMAYGGLSKSYKDSIAKYKSYWNRLEEVRRLKTRSVWCKTWQDVMYVKAHSAEFSGYPYRNASELDYNFAGLAYESYGSFLLSEANECLRKYTRARARVNSSVWERVKSPFTNPYKPYREQAKRLCSTINSVRGQVPSKNRYKYDKAINILSNITR